MTVTFLTDKDKERLVQIEPQGFTEEQKAQARENVGAASQADMAKATERLLAAERDFPVVCSASGEVVTVHDASDHALKGLTLYGKTTQFTTTGKNWLKNTATTQTINGVTFSVNDDRSIVVNGTATAEASFIITPKYTLPAGSYILTGCPSGGNAGSRYVLYSGAKADYSGGAYDEGNGITISYDGSEYINPRIIIASGYVCSNLTFKPMVRLASISDNTYEPYTGGMPSPNPDYPQEMKSVGDDGSVGVTMYGENLLHINDGVGGYNGVDLVVKDGVVTINGTVGTETDSVTIWYLGQYDVITPTIVLPAGTYTASDCCIWSYDGVTRRKFQNTFTVEDSLAVTGVSTASYGIGVSLNETLYPMLNAGNTALPWKPYKGQTLALSTPNGLPGIPVSSGGNYTDANGQQWICDEIDLTRGVYVQNTTRDGIGQFYNIAFPNDPRWYDTNTTNSYEITGQAPGKPPLASRVTGLCNVLPSFRFEYFYNMGIVDGIMNSEEYVVVNLDKSRGIDTVEKFKAWCNEIGLEVIKPLAEPIETPLSAEEIAAFKALHTNKPNTTVYTDSNAGIKLDYVADTKTYIDNKFAELAAAIVNNT